MKYTILLVSIFVIFLFFLPACQKTPSLFPVLQKAEACMESHPDSALSLLEAIPFPEKLSKEEYVTWCLLVTQARDKNYVEHTSDSVINIAVQYFEKQSSSKRKAQSYYCQGRVLSDLLESGEALEAYLKALEAVQQTTEYGLKARICNHLGTLYWKNRSKMKSLECYKMAKTAYEECGDTVGIVNALRNIGRSFADIQETDSAMFYLEEALSLAENGEMTNLRSSVLQYIANLLSEKGLYSQALEYNMKGLAIAGNNEAVFSQYFAIASLYEKLNNMDSALFYAEQAIGGKSIYVKCSTNRLLYTLYAKGKRYEKAFENNEQYLLLKDSIEHLYEPTALARIEALYNKVRLESKQNKKIQEFETKRNIGILFFLCVCIVALLLYIYLGRRISKQKQLLKEYERQLKESNQSLVGYQRKMDKQNEQLSKIQKELVDRQKLLDDYINQIQLLEDEDLKKQEVHKSEIEKVKKDIQLLICEKERVLAEKADLASKSSLLLEQQSELLLTIERLSKDKKAFEEHAGDMEKRQKTVREEQEKLEHEKKEFHQEKERRFQQEKEMIEENDRLFQVCEDLIKVAIERNRYISRLIVEGRLSEFGVNDWLIFEENFDQIFPNFRMSLRAQFQELSERDIRICCLTKLGFKTGVLVCIFNLEADTITKLKLSIKEKCFPAFKKQSLGRLLENRY